MFNKILLTLMIAAAMLPCAFAQHPAPPPGGLRPEPREVPLNQEIPLGDLSVTLEPYQSFLGDALLVTVQSTTVRAYSVIVVAYITTADGVSQRYIGIAGWLPDSTIVSLHTSAPVVSVSSVAVIPIGLNQIHATT